jgi:hypothetical protein
MLHAAQLATLPVSAASGLVSAGGLLHIVADDELDLVTVDTEGRLVRRTKLFPGELPEEKHARKRLKPDLETLCLFDGAFLTLGSGSTDRRARGALVTLAGEVTVIDLAPLYERLRQDIPELNLEGVAVSGSWLRLLQRGNGPARLNAVVDLHLDGVRTALAGRRLGPELLARITPVTLPDGLTFTDASPLSDGSLVFSAAAESSPNTYEDGETTASAVGILAPDLSVPTLVGLAGPPLKIEGVDATPTEAGLELLLVADADDPSVQAPLLRAVLTR